MFSTILQFLEFVRNKEGSFNRGEKKYVIKNDKIIITSFTCSNCGLRDNYYALVNWRSGEERTRNENVNEIGEDVVLCSKCCSIIYKKFGIGMNLKKI